MQRFFRSALLAMIIVAGGQVAFAQGLADSLSQDESNIVSGIAPYAPDMRAAILNVSQYPQVLVKLERAQARTSQSFQDLVSAYPREEQEKFYQLSRYPDLVSQLAQLSGRSSDEVNNRIKNYPEGVQQPAQDIYRDHFGDLAKIDGIYQSSQNTLDRVIAKYPSQLQDDFRKVVANPDVMTLLTDNIDLTVSLGESYKSDPQGTTQYLDSLNVAINGQNAKDLQDYKTAVESDPKLQAEMKKAADDFATQYDQQGTTGGNVTNNNYYGTSPYPYWFGYPYWYNSPMWYPTPFYYNTGFYYGPGGGMVVVGLPSYAYAHWFFGYGYRHYPRLYGHYNTYYNVHRANIINGNVYRGFNTEARGHFGAINRGRNIQSRTRTVYNNNNRYSNTGVVNTPNRSGWTRSRPMGATQRPSMNTNMHPTNFNNSGFNHFNATSFHNMGWQSMHSGGGMYGGGMHGGGMHGGRR